MRFSRGHRSNHGAYWPARCRSGRCRSAWCVRGIPSKTATRRPRPVPAPTIERPSTTDAASTGGGGHAPLSYPGARFPGTRPCFSRHRPASRVGPAARVARSARRRDRCLDFESRPLVPGRSPMVHRANRASRYGPNAAGAAGFRGPSLRCVGATTVRAASFLVRGVLRALPRSAGADGSRHAAAANRPWRSTHQRQTRDGPVSLETCSSFPRSHGGGPCSKRRQDRHQSSVFTLSTASSGLHRRRRDSLCRKRPRWRWRRLPDDVAAGSRNATDCDPYRRDGTGIEAGGALDLWRSPRTADPLRECPVPRFPASDPRCRVSLAGIAAATKLVKSAPAGSRRSRWRLPVVTAGRPLTSGTFFGGR